MYRSITRLCYSSAPASILHAKVVGKSHPNCVSAIALQSVRYYTPSPPSNNASLVHSLNVNHEFFNFTRGRFLCDETLELKRRHHTFNVHELMRVAAQSVGSTHCEHIEKLPEGMYNRVLLFSMENGQQVIAKIPNPNSGRPHFTTASEVATMKFAREVLGTPVPKIYAWSSRADDNAVGAEYIIMEKMTGIELEHVWPKMKIHERFQVVRSLAQYQHAWSSFSFEHFGSLYLSEDLKGEAAPHLAYSNDAGGRIVDERFSVGPSCGRETFDDGRDNIQFDRGPWKSLSDYHAAIAGRELACVQGVSSLPPSPVTLRGPNLYQPSREKKESAINAYASLMNFSLPQDRSISSAHIWHNDLHAGNIFVDPSEPTKIVGLIDWQCAEIAPLYFHSRQPHFIDHQGPELYGLTRPSLPSNLDQLDTGTKKEANRLYLAQFLCSLYRTLVHSQSPNIYKCFEFQQEPSFTLLLLARNLLIDGEAAYMFNVVKFEKIWDTLPGTKGVAFPISLSEDLRGDIVKDMEAAALGMDVMRGMHESLGGLFLTHGWVPHDQYDEAVDALSQMEEQVISMHAHDDHQVEEWNAQWPFRR